MSETMGELFENIIAVSPTSRHRWATISRWRLTVSDLAVTFMGAVAAQAVALPTLTTDVAGPAAAPQPSYWVLSLAIASAWSLILAANGSRSTRVLGSGAEEYRLVLGALIWMLGGLGFASYALRYEVGRGYVLVALPLGTALLLASRWAWRMVLNSERAQGGAASRVLTIEAPQRVGTIARHIGESPKSGLRVVGQMGVEERDQLTEKAARLAATLDVDAVVVASSAHLEPDELRSLMWALESVGADLILAPSLSGIAGPRVHTRPIEGLPLLYVQGPQYTGAMRTVKDTFDKVFSAIALALLSPLFAVIALAVKLTSPGAVFYRQIRVGLGGAEFRIWKFRSMTDGADAQLHKMAEENGGLAPLVKFKNDARVTPVGQFLRKWSLDELPQLINVLQGHMSLVGPRPQRPAEVSTYTATHARRLKTKPGMTGMWQVSGRSDVAWDDAVRMDLYYVENWSLSLDMVLIWRTIFAVLRGKGAY